MNEIDKGFLKEVLKANLSPFLFLIIAGVMCFLLPAEARNEAVYLVIGAALTRVKIPAK